MHMLVYTYIIENQFGYILCWIAIVYYLDFLVFFIIDLVIVIKIYFIV